MAKEINYTKLQQDAEKCYRDFLNCYRVTREANVTKKEEKALVEKTKAAVKVCEDVFGKIEAQTKNSADDDARYTRQTIQEYRKSLQEFKNIYGEESEPNA